MLTNYLFKDLYHDRWGDPSNPNAVDPPLPGRKSGTAGRSLLGRLAGVFRRHQNRPSAWSFTIPSEAPDMDGEAETGHRARLEAPKFLTLAKVLSRNC